MIRDEKDKREEQERILTLTVREVFFFFSRKIMERLDYGKRKFTEYRPPLSLLPSRMPKIVCNCQYLNNIFLILKCLHEEFPSIFPLYS